MTFALATGGVGWLQRSLYIRSLSAALGVGFCFGAIQIFDIRCIIEISEASIIIIDNDDDDDEKEETRSVGFFVLIDTSSRWQKSTGIGAQLNYHLPEGGSRNRISRPFFLGITVVGAEI